MQGRSVILSCKLFLIWGISSAWNKLPIPAFSFRVLGYTLLSSQVLLGACVLFWMVGERMCSVPPIDSVPAWNNSEGCVGMGLLHPSHWWFSALSELGSFLSRLLAQKPGGCWTLNKASKRQKKPQCPYALNHSHTRAHFNLAVQTAPCRAADEVSACSRKKNKKTRKRVN